MEIFIVGIVVGAVLVYFYHKRKQPKPNYNDATGIPENPRDNGNDHPNKS